MAIEQWQPGTIYIPGTLVLPTTVQGATATLIANADFEGGATGWTLGAGWSVTSNAPFSGANSAEYNGPGANSMTSTVKHPIEPGKSITASCFVHQGASDDGQANAAVTLNWYDSGGSLLSVSTGNSVSTGEVGIWRKSAVSAVAPSLCASVSIGCLANNDWAALNVDNFAWNYVTGAAAAALAFKAVQTDAGTSGASEPDWPTSVGGTVVDNEVTWEAVEIDSVTWEASSILTSGSQEPNWPAENGAFVFDNNIAWEAVPLRIEDENCPHTKVVAIAASKVFAGDTDIVRFCATLNARDWSSEDDAGFLPTGLQQKSQVGVNAMGVYRGNLAVWSPSTFQVWQVDPDPAAMALLDAMEGIGSTHQQAVQPVSDDLFFLAALGVRTVSIAEGSNNLQSGDVGVPIDVLVQAEANAVDVEPVASYYPAGGQYWLAFRPLTIAATLLAGQFLLSSTFYPIEQVEGMEISCVLTSGYLLPGIEEAAEGHVNFIGGTLLDQLLTAPIQDEAFDGSTQFIAGDLRSELFTETVDEAAEGSVAFVEGDLRYNLIKALAPDEGLDFTIELTSGSLTIA